MKIAINVDGVLLNKADFQYKYGQEFFKDKLFFRNEAACHFRDMFNCSREEQDMFWKKYALKYYTKVKPEEGASEFTRRLKEDMHDIYLMVSRKNILDCNMKGYFYRLLLNRWLSNNDIFYDGIVYCDYENSVYDKYNACKNIGFDYIVDDKISDILCLSYVSNVLIFNRQYNIGLVKYDRFYNFDDMYHFLEMKGKKKVKKYE